MKRRIKRRPRLLKLRSSVDDRKTAAEAKFTHDQEFQFKTIARRNKLLGLWAAEQMGISGVDAGAYAKQVVIAYFEEPGDADVLRKVLGEEPRLPQGSSMCAALSTTRYASHDGQKPRRLQEKADRYS